MALIVEDGTGVAGAESYVSVTYADTYWANRSTSSFAAAWNAANTAQKESALRQASTYIDASYNFQGRIVLSTQTLYWPREYIYDSLGTELSAQVPARLQQATVELAARALSGDLQQDTTRGGAVKREKVDTLEVEYFTGAPAGVQYPFITALLAPYITNSNASVDLARA